ncbi:HAD domain-containing protein [Variovorax ureilyticus]|uniref:HAD domain-containing protein n=1 Tax=Variovorax ureilyticus TaxID=1836198 RepID=UPI003D6670FD
MDQTFRPLYVLTTSWWWILDDETLRQVLERVGLGFVVENLHEDCATPKGPKPDLRWNEICAWLGAHPEAKDDWVVLDDYLSGTGLVRAHPPDSREIAP